MDIPGRDPGYCYSPPAGGGAVAGDTTIPGWNPGYYYLPTPWVWGGWVIRLSRVGTRAIFIYPLRGLLIYQTAPEVLKRNSPGRSPGDKSRKNAPHRPGGPE